MLPWFFASNADVDKALSGSLGQELLQIVEAKNILGSHLGSEQDRMGWTKRGYPENHPPSRR